MASNTENVKLGVCKITKGGIDLGYTKGGVEVEVTTDTHAVTVDQFGESVVNEFITKRDIKVKMSLAETTLDNLVATMPGATLISDGAKASGTVNFGTTNAIANDTVTVNGVVFTFKASPVGPAQVAVGANVAASLANLLAKLQASTNTSVALAAYTSNATTTLTATYKLRGTEGNAFTLAASVATASGATLSGGTNPTKQRVEVTNAIGTNLLSIAEPLLLHPIENLDTDESDDLLIPLAATAGGMNFAYKHDTERVYNVEFMGYPDPVTKVLFKLGDSEATAS